MRYGVGIWKIERRDRRSICSFGGKINARSRARNNLRDCTASLGSFQILLLLLNCTQPLLTKPVIPDNTLLIRNLLVQLR